jgi:hypothetical protein
LLQSNAYLRDDINILLHKEADRIADEKIASRLKPVAPVVIPPGRVETP